jgi:hypothetical protein
MRMKRRSKGNYFKEDHFIMTRKELPTKREKRGKEKDETQN